MTADEQTILDIRRRAVEIANQRAAVDATVDSIVADATKIITFLTAGITIAVPQG